MFSAHVLAAIVAERDRLAGPHAVDGVVERVHEHPPTELAVGNDVEPGFDLARDGEADRLVLQGAERSSIFARSSLNTAECPGA